MLGSPPYVVCLNLSGRRCLVAGGGVIGQQKTTNLLACGAKVALVSPGATKTLERLAAAGEIEWHSREFQDADLDEAFLVVASTENSETNRRIFELADARGMLVNVVDAPALCNFILPAIVRNEPITIAVSTAGASPALAKRLRTEIANRYGEPYARLAKLLDAERDWAQAALPTYDARRAFFEGIVNGEPDPVAMLAEGDEAGVRARIEQAKQKAGT